MEDAELLHIHFHSTGPRCWWQQPLPPSCFLSAGREKRNTSIPFFLFFLPPQNKIHLLTAAGAWESLSLCVSEHGCASKFPAYFLLPASRWRCSAYKQLTVSTILWSHDLGHYQIRAITCYSSLSATAASSGTASEWGHRRVCLCVIIILDLRG